MEATSVARVARPIISTSIPSQWNRPRLLSSSPSWKISQPPLPVSKSISLRLSIGSEKNRTFVVCSSASSEGELPIEKRYPAFPAVCDIFKILDTLPHRYPFLYVDRVIEYNPGVSIVAIKNVTINDNFFPGHLPERPLMPGVLIIEAMAQVAGILLTQPGQRANGTVFPFAALDKVRFRKPVMAGDTLVMRMTLVKQQKPFSKLEGKAYVNGQVACEGEFLLGTWQLE